MGHFAQDRYPGAVVGRFVILASTPEYSTYMEHEEADGTVCGSSIIQEIFLALLII